MIFKVFDSDIDKWTAKIGVFGKSFYDLGEAINQAWGNSRFNDTTTFFRELKNNLSTEEIKPIDVDALYPKIDHDTFDFDKWIGALNETDKKVRAGATTWQDYSDSLDENQRWIAQWGQQTEGAIRTQEDMIRANVDMRHAALAQNEAIKQQSLSYKLLSAGMKVAAIAGNILLSIVISKVISVISEMAKAQEHLEETARDLGDALKSTTSDINSYKKRINELHETINDSNSSVEEVSQARIELMSVQDELIDKFGTEQDVIQSVTNAINGQTDALDNLSRKAYYDSLTEFNNKTTGQKVKDFITYGNSDSAPTNMDEMVSQMQNRYFALSTTGNQVLDELIAKTYNLRIENDMYGNGRHFGLVGSLEEIDGLLFEIQSITSGLEVSDEFTNEFAALSQEIDGTLESFRNLYDKYVLYEKILTNNDVNYVNEYKEINDAKEAYDNAISEGNAELIEREKQNFITVLSDAMEEAKNNGDLDVVDYFSDMYPALQKEISEWKFLVDFEPSVNENDIRNKISGALNTLKNFSTEELLGFNIAAHTDEQVAAYGVLESVAYQYGMQIEQLIALLQKQQLIVPQVYEELVNTFGNEKVSTLSDEDLSIAYTIDGFTLLSWDELLERIIQAKINAKGLFGYFNDTTFGKRIKHASELFKEGEISHKQYFDTLQNEINNVDFSHYLDSLEEIQDAEKQFFTDSVQQSASGLSSLINKFDNNNIGVSEYLDGYLSIAETVSILTDSLQENSSAWNKNGESISDAQSTALDNIQNNLHSAMDVVKELQDSTYALEQITSGAVDESSDDFKSYTNTIAADLAGIVSAGGEMADDISSYMGQSADEIAKALLEDTSNFAIAEEAIAENTNVAITNMANTIAKLFDELGKAISEFKVNLSFKMTDDSSTLWQALRGKGSVNYELAATGDSLSTIGNSISSFGKSISEGLAQQLIETGDYHRGTVPENSNSKYKPNKNVTNKFKDSTDAAKEATDDIIDFFERRVEVLEQAFGTLEAGIENVLGAKAKNTVLAGQLEILDEETRNYTDALAMYQEAAEGYLALIPEQYREAAKNGEVSLLQVNDENVKEAIENYQQWANKVAECTQKLEELKAQIRELELEKFNNIIKDFTDQFDLHGTAIDNIDKQIELLEEAGELIGSSYYTKQIEQSEKQLALLEQQKLAMVEQLNDSLSSGRVKTYALLCSNTQAIK